MRSPARVPHRPPVAPAVLTLLDAARGELVAAAASPSTAQRYAAAHLAALRAAAAGLAARAHPAQPVRRGAPRSVWALLAAVAPELSEWAAFFAAGARKRAAAEAGLAHVVTVRDADALLRDAQVFLGLVAGTLGLPHQLPDEHSTLSSGGDDRTLSSGGDDRTLSSGGDDRALALADGDRVSG